MINIFNLVFIIFVVIFDNFILMLVYWKGGLGVYNVILKNFFKKIGLNRKLICFYEFFIILLRFRLVLLIFVIVDIFGILCIRVL